MEGATINTPSSPINTFRVYHELYDVATRLRLINSKVIKHDTLDGLTRDVILEGFRNKEPMINVRQNLLELWFPSLASAVHNLGSWSRCFDLDLEVDEILRKAEYPYKDDDRLKHKIKVHCMPDGTEFETVECDSFPEEY